jgi:hypothetical protein
LPSGCRDAHAACERAMAREYVAYDTVRLASCDFSANTLRRSVAKAVRLRNCALCALMTCCPQRGADRDGSHFPDQAGLTLPARLSGEKGCR